jgi:formylglycine-generating enzyme required for sulfatase activity
MLRFLLLICCLVALSAQAANRNASVKETSESRVALVIGNSAYRVKPLPNPVHDAEDVASKLRSLGFEVIERHNLSSKEIGSTLREFRSKLSPGAVALVFYAGHGLQIDGENYLPAVDADINSEEDVPNQSLSVKQVMSLLDVAKTRLNLVFLDACRNNPYASRSFRSTERGLARISAPSGTLISYATKPGSVANDGDGRNGLYTSKLLGQMNSSQPIEQSIKRIVSEVKKDSHGKQEPWMEGSIEGDFCFAGCLGSMPQANVPATPTKTAEQIEDEFWEAIKNSSDVENFEEYRRQYPQGRYLKIANLKINQLRRPIASVPPVAVRPAPAPTRLAYEPDMVSIPSGSFTMGCQDGRDKECDSDEKPAHTVGLSAFELGKTEVTQGQWKAVMGSNPSNFSSCGDACPVEQVSWDDVQTFIQKLNAQTSKAYRLPSEAEWEYACRAGKDTHYCGGNDVDAVAWYDSNSGSKTHPVGGKQANAWGLSDMSGNVWEWVQDTKHSDYNGAPANGSSWEGGVGRVLRGGSWGSNAWVTRAAIRYSFTPTYRILNVGFRLARTPQ